METSLYQFIFKDGRVYRVYCANRKQKMRALATMEAVKAQGGSVEVMTNGIHNIKQWEQIIKSY